MWLLKKCGHNIEGCWVALDAVTVSTAVENTLSESDHTLVASTDRYSLAILNRIGKRISFSFKWILIEGNTFLFKILLYLLCNTLLHAF